jgi:hypothetical protein
MVTIERTRHRASSGAGSLRLVSALSALLLAQLACGVDLSVSEAVDYLWVVEVQMEFTESHSGVTATGRLDVIDDFLDRIPGPAKERDAGERSADLLFPETSGTGVYVLAGSVYPIRAERLVPGLWELSIEVKDGAGNVLIDVDRCRFTLNATLTAGQDTAVKVLEGSPGCTSNEEPVGEPIVPRRDLAVQQLEILGAEGFDHAAQTVIQGTVLEILVPVWNVGEVSGEDFAVGLEVGPGGGVVSPATREVFDMDPFDEPQNVSFSWDTTTATSEPHQLRAFIDVELDANPANNEVTATIEVLDPPVSNILVTAITVVGAPVTGSVASVSADQDQTVEVALQNAGGLDEDVVVRLEEAPFEAGAVGTPRTVLGQSPALALPIGNATSYSFPPWSPTTSGDRALIASAGTSEAVQRVFVEARDLAVAIGALGSTTADAGNTVDIPVLVTNLGNAVAQDFSVRLRATPTAGGPAVEIESRVVPTLAVSDPPTPVTLDFAWDTACLAAGDYTLDVSIDFANDANPGNDADQAGPVTLSVDRELSIVITDTIEGTGPPPQWAVIAQVTNGRSVAETGVDVSITSAPTPGFSGTPGNDSKDPRLPADLACDETGEFVFTWYPPSFGAALSYDITLDIQNAIPGDDPADNSATVSICLDADGDCTN